MKLEKEEGRSRERKEKKESGWRMTGGGKRKGRKGIRAGRE